MIQRIPVGFILCGQTERSSIAQHPLGVEHLVDPLSSGDIVGVDPAGNDRQLESRVEALLARRDIGFNLIYDCT